MTFASLASLANGCGRAWRHGGRAWAAGEMAATIPVEGMWRDRKHMETHVFKLYIFTV